MPRPKATSDFDQALLDRRCKAGAWLKQLREDANLTTQNLSSIAEIAREFITGVERGDCRLPTTHWSNYAYALGVKDAKAFGKTLLELYDATLFTLLFGDSSTLTDEHWTRRTGTRKTTSEETEGLRKVAGHWLKEQRENAGLTQLEVAVAMGLRTNIFVSQVEMGLARLPRERYPLYSKLLNLNPKYFALQMTEFNDPEIYRILFGSAPVDMERKHRPLLRKKPVA